MGLRSSWSGGINMPIFYMDYVNGLDATTDTPLGWWSVAYTGGTAPAPAADEVVTGATSLNTAKLSVVVAPTSGSWAGGDAAGTMYFYGKSGAFVAEQVDCAGGGHFDIAADFVYCAWKTITSGATAARIAPGDIIRIAKSPDPTSLGMTASWTNLSRAVVLNSAVTANVDLCEAAWTAATADVTTSAVGGFCKEGSFSSSIAIATDFGTGKVAYDTLGGATDYSGYEQLSFWILTDVSVADNVLKLCLCSDAIGDTIIDEFVIPTVPGTSTWTIFTVDKSATLGASIQSVALYAIADPGTVTVYLDNIIACKAANLADSLSLTSLISKNSLAQGGTEGWYGIKSINGTAIELDNDTSSGAGAGSGYSGTTETVTTYKRETIKTILAPNYDTPVQEIQDSGTIGNNIEYQGGYNTVSIIQDGETFFDGSHSYGNGLQLSSKSYNTINYLNFSRYRNGIYFDSGSNNNTITTISNVNNNETGMIIYGNNTITTILNANNNNNIGIYLPGSVTITTISNVNSNFGDGIRLGGNNNIITTITNANNNGSPFTGQGVYFQSGNNNTITTITNANNNAIYGIAITGSNNNTITTITNANNNAIYGIAITGSNNNTITTITNANNNAIYGIAFIISNNNTIRSLSTSGNTSGGIYNDTGTNYVNKAVIAEATKVTGLTTFVNSRIFANNYNNDTNDHRIYTDGGTIVSQIVTRHTASGIAWQLSPTSADRSILYPLDLSIAKIAVSANNLVTVKGWFRRDNIGLTMQLVCKGGQIAGVPSDVVASMTAIADTWEELTITFTPTEVGVVEIQAWAYGGTTYSGYVDDMTITQA